MQAHRDDGEPLNHALLPENTCFGCSAHNPAGLHVELRRDPSGADALVATLRPTEQHTGFPGIVHGGVLFTALDCLAAWVPTVLRSETKAIWILRTARIAFHRPTFAGTVVHLHGSIAPEGDAAGELVVHTEARDEAGALLADADFTVRALPPEKFRRVAGGIEIPPGWKRLLGIEAPPA